MATNTKIQWCDSTVNPIMGCGGCELFPPASKILEQLDIVLGKLGPWAPGTSKVVYKHLIEAAYAAIHSPLEGHSKALTTTNLWHLRFEFCKQVAERLSKRGAHASEQAINSAVTCYAAKLHLNKAQSIAKPTRGFNPGYAPVFEAVTSFSGRVKEAARLSDLRDASREDKPWLDGLPRHIFISDMGDAFSRASDFSFLEDEVIGAVKSDKGKRHVWLWLTKRPERMAKFGEGIGGFPQNVIAMTTLTGSQTLDRVEALRRVPASTRGLSIEPLRERIPAEKLDLRGINWVIVGGESGRGDCVTPFDLKWARELRTHCLDRGVACFIKQLGRRPIESGEELRLRDGHGGDWSEWPADLRVREMPEALLA